MAFNHTIVQSVQASGSPIVTTNTYTASSSIRLEESAADDGTTAISVAIDVSAVKSFFVVSSQDVILETNSASAADDTINLVAGVPYVWNIDSYDTFKLGTDVTSIHITNSSGSAATIQLEAIVDATP